MADLDELTIRVRNPQSRRNIEEAVRVLRAGSPKAAILLTWLAVVYDVVGKLRELDDAGDAQAKGFRAEYEKIHASGEIKNAQDFEGRIPAIASSLELVSRVEQQDLERLQKDRHRCAHPSQTDEDTPYSPSDELARSHLLVAVECLLQHPPSQGKAALARLQADIDSPYFPDNDADALRRLKSSPLHRARSALIRNLAITLVKGILECAPDERSGRRRRALVAVWDMHPAELDTIAHEKLAKLVTEVDDSQLRRVIFLCRPLPRFWALLPQETKSRVKRFADNPPQQDARHVTGIALGIPDLASTALRRLKVYGAEDFTSVLRVIGSHLPDALARELIAYQFSVLGYKTLRGKLPYFAALARYMNGNEIARFIEALANEEDISALEACTVLGKMPEELAEPAFAASPLAARWSWGDVSIPF